MNQLSKPDRAHFLHEKLKEVVDTAKHNFFIMGAILQEIHDNKYYETMGYDTFPSYLADPEIGIKASTAYHAINIVKHFTIEETSGVNYSKLIRIVSKVTDKNKDELVLMARTLSTSDLVRELKKMEGNEEEELTRKVTCPHCQKEFNL